MSFVELATGSEFGGRYRIVSRLAAGGMGTVYEVIHLETARRRALKVMQSDLFQNAALRERFRKEAKVTANVESEFLVDVFDAGVDSATGMPFLVMELLVGEDLGKRLERLGPLAPAEVVSLLEQAASALDKTHAASIVHRDLKPANLFLARQSDGSLRVKILDFGISKIVSEATNDLTSRALGTPAYMAPEQLLGEAVSAATDVHALGLIAYTLLVGESYWQEDVESVDNVFAFALRAQAGPTDSPLARAKRLGRELPSEFEPWFERATRRDAKERFRSASEAVAALARALAVPAASAPPVLSQGVAIDATSGRNESALKGVRWLAVPAALLLTLGVIALLARGPAPAELSASEPAPREDVELRSAQPDSTVPAPRAFPEAPATAASAEAANAPAPPQGAGLANTPRARRSSRADGGKQPPPQPPPAPPPSAIVPASVRAAAAPPTASFAPPAPSPPAKPRHTRD